MKINNKKKKQLLKQHPPKPPKPRTFTETEAMQFAQEVLIGYLASSMIVLRDKFGFGAERLERFLLAESSHAQAIKEGRVNKDELLQAIKDETGFDFYAFIRTQSELHKEKGETE